MKSEFRLTHPPNRPISGELVEGFRHFLGAICTGLFGNDVSEMATELGCDEAAVEGSLQATDLSELHPAVVQAAWNVAFDQLGLRAFLLIPEPLRQFGLTVEVLDPTVDRDGAERAASTMSRGADALNGMTLARDLYGPSGRRFVVSVQDGIVLPDVPSDAHLVAVQMEGTSRLHVDGIYVVRLDDTIQIRRLQRRPNFRVHVLGDADRDAVTLDLDDPTFDVIGRIWGMFARTGQRDESPPT